MCNEIIYFVNMINCFQLIVVVPRSELHLILILMNIAATVQQQVSHTGTPAEIHQGPFSVQPLRERLPISACKAQTYIFIPAVG